MILDRKLKRAQIGLTFSWFVAFIVVAVIMVFFIISVVFIAAAKETADYDNLGLESGDSLKNLENQRKMEYLLNAPVKDLEGNYIQIKDLVGLWFNDKNKYNDLLESSLKGVLDELEYESYNYKTENWRVNAFEIFINPEPIPSVGGISYDLRVDGEKYKTGFCSRRGGFCNEVAYSPVHISKTNIVHAYLRKSVAARSTY